MRDKNLERVETRADFIAWLEENLPYARIHGIAGEIVIYTGLSWEMNGELYPIESGDE